MWGIGKNLKKALAIELQIYCDMKLKTEDEKSRSNCGHSGLNIINEAGGRLEISN